MPAKQQDKQHLDNAKQEREQMNAVIGNHLMHTLGQPGDLLKVQVKPLWDNHYRVNVLVGTEFSCAKVAHSYFLEADSAGNITASTPKITKAY